MPSLPSEIHPVPPSDGGGSKTNVGDAERWLSVLAGTTLAVAGLRRGGGAGIATALAGAALLQRGVTGHCQVYSTLGIDTAEWGRIESAVAKLPADRALHVERVFTVRRPPEELYSFWRKLENLPRFMKHLERVDVLDEGRSHWVAKGPAGTRIEWDAQILEDAPNQRITWRSLEGSDVANDGTVHFDPAPGDRGTEVRVSLAYVPPAGKLGATIAKLFGENPEQQVRDDLRRFKNLMEAGEIPTTEGQPSGRN